MKSNNVIIFDTNILYVTYERGGDFTLFYFNSTFKNIIDYIQKIDMYENIEIMIPDVVWNEMKKQKIDAYIEKKEEIKSKLSKIKIPDITITEKDVDYYLYIDNEIEKYKTSIGNELIKVENLMLPSSSRFESIIKRAFEKNPPFEGKDKKSDKGFKDALLWESILEYKIRNKSKNIILYCKDNNFNDFLEREYAEKFNDKISIFNNEQDLINYIDKLAIKTLDSPNLENKIEIDEIKIIKNFINSKDFRIRLTGSLDQVNIFNDFYIIEDIGNVVIKSIVNSSNSENIVYDVELEISIMLNKPSGSIDDIIEKEKNILVSITMKDKKVGKLSFEYQNTYFEEE